MAYLFIPLAIFVVAVVAVAIIVGRKVSYLRKLSPESHETGDTILHDFAPEVIDWARGVPWRQYLHRALSELEIGLNRLRQAMYALGHASESVMKGVRKAGQKAARSHEAAVAQLEEEKKEREAEFDPDEVDLTDPEQLKAEEQRLIIAIAQNPKDVSLYSDIARVYMRLHAYGDAVEALEQAVKLDPDTTEYLKRLERARRKRDGAV
ncbi:MAG TPA: hypothetical protein VMU12_02340 [Candidatus Paceibacterota bacterium]|nr:hypothetical protein [Candidatus Paceibacterota bacterium]